jgi:hypothetical protein
VFYGAKSAAIRLKYSCLRSRKNRDPHMARRPFAKQVCGLLQLLLRVLLRKSHALIVLCEITPFLRGVPPRGRQKPHWRRIRQGILA